MSGIVEIVDVGPLFAPNDCVKKACDLALWSALRRDGAVVVTGYPQAHRLDERAAEGLRIFDLPLQEKTRLATRLIVAGNVNTYRGYWPRRTGSLLQNEFFDVGPTDPAAGPDLPGMDILTEPTPWPESEPTAGWGGTVRALYDQLNRLAQTMAVSLTRSAGFEEDSIRTRFEGRHSTLRFLRYPKGAVATAVEPDGVRVAGSRHTDACGLTLHWQAQSGLQVQGADGAFRDVPVVESGICIHAGDVMKSLTRGIVAPAPHRVLASGGQRQSIGFFLEPALAAPITPVDQDASSDVADTYAWLLLDKLAGRGMWRGVIDPPQAMV